jgi:hypothetical protein
MGHNHSEHSHAEDAHAFKLDQLCTIALCGGLATVGILMYHQGMLSFLVDWFHLPVLAGCITLLVLVAIRGVALWRAEAAEDHHDHSHDDHHEHNHGEGECCGHDHGHHHEHEDREPASGAVGHEHAHDHGKAASGGHDHDHEHGWQPWRYMVLLFPITLYMLDLPSKEFSQDYIAHRLPKLEDVQIMNLAAQADMDDKPFFIEFSELKQAAYVPQLRAALDGKTRKVLGQFVQGDTDYTCSLVRIKMQCCAADAQPLNVVIISPEKLTDLKPLEWVEIEGVVQFRKRRDKNEYLPVLQIKGRDKIKPAEAPKQLYI